MSDDQAYTDFSREPRVNSAPFLGLPPGTVKLVRVRPCKRWPRLLRRLTRGLSAHAVRYEFVFRPGGWPPNGEPPP